MAPNIFVKAVPFSYSGDAKYSSKNRTFTADFEGKLVAVKVGETNRKTVSVSHFMT